MHMHATTADGMLQHALIRKDDFVTQCRWEAGRTEIFA
jgi:hypothetical protein